MEWDRTLTSFHYLDSLGRSGTNVSFHCSEIGQSKKYYNFLFHFYPYKHLTKGINTYKVIFGNILCLFNWSARYDNII